ncbi:hypothetical protein B0T22DRAFT_477146 [Podospora appendiculata]|uniref:Uncharacterized protein n=1 Tax=Podospora appendiculata TaxID=314037 RepID=A0AAE0XJ18_9PEZI|nr:hypothetical protein B0T22DRAFT_477146 [Podospora appendiculata]
MLANYYPATSIHVAMPAGEAPDFQMSSDEPALWANPDNFLPWADTTAHAHSSAYGSNPGAQFVDTWRGGVPPSGHGNATVLNQAADDTAWLAYGQMPAATDYFGMPSQISSAGAVFPETAWDAHDQPLFSPYSEVPPSIINNTVKRSSSVEDGFGGSLDGTSFDAIPRWNDMSGPASPNAAPETSAKSKGKSKSKPKSKPISTKTASKTDSRSRTGASAAGSGSGSGSGSTKGQSGTHKRKSSQASELPPAPPAAELVSQIYRVASEKIGREAWRICKAEAREMAQRRGQLLEHESGALERETQQLQLNVSMLRETASRQQMQTWLLQANVGGLRDTVSRQQMDLEDAIRRAELLASGSFPR